jgi:hypothetical protein
MFHSPIYGKVFQQSITQKDAKMIDRTSTVQDIDWFTDMLVFKRLNLDPPYQRYAVWSLRYKQYFIDTILNNFPAPPIFLHKVNISSKDHIYNVVDGKQRLLSIFRFQDNEFPLPKDDNRYPGKYFDDLPSNVQTEFGNYQIPVEILSTGSELDLREAFDRLNRNVRKLNRQELRHARHDGPFIEMAEIFAKNSFWQDIDISNYTRVQSMKDVEFVSEIFLLTVHGVKDLNPNVLDEYYAEYDDEEGFEAVEKHRRAYEGCMSIMERLGVSFFRETRFSNLADFYSLWAALLEYADQPDDIDYEETRKELKAFSELMMIPNNIPAENEIALKYSDAVRQGTNKKENRQIRAEILKGFIKTK